MIMKRYLFALGLAVSLSAGVSVQAQTAYYVSASLGNDTWSGTLAAPNGGLTDGPFKTLAKAQTTMRGSAIKTTTVRAGTYNLASDWAFTSADNGQTWVAYSGESPVIDGGGVGYIVFDKVSNVSFSRLTINRTGGTDLYNSSFSPAGIYLSGGSNNNSIRWNNFTNCVKACITGDGSPTNNVIDSNTFNGQTPGDHPGTTNFYGAIMFWYGAADIRITHNLFQNLDGGAVLFATGTSDPPANNNVIDRNIADTVCNNVDDCGVWYIFDGSHSVTGNQVTNNTASNIGGSGYLSNWTKCIYMDDLMSNIIISGNICRGGGMFATQIHAGTNVTYQCNIFDLSRSGVKLMEYDTSPVGDFNMTGNVVTKNTIYSQTSFPSTFWWLNLGPSDALPTMTQNLYFSANSSSIPNVDVVDNNRVLANPQFANAANGDYTMPGNSPVYTTLGCPTFVTDRGPLPYPGAPAIEAPAAPSGLTISAPNG